MESEKVTYSTVTKERYITPPQDGRMQDAQLTNIEVAGYKSFGTGDNKLSIQLRPLNVIIGANGSGKSNFISLFDFLLSALQEDFDDYVARNGGANNLLHFGKKKTKSIEVKLSFSNTFILGTHRLLLESTTKDSLAVIKNEDTWHESKTLGLYIDEDDAFDSFETFCDILDRCGPYRFADTSVFTNNTKVLDNMELHTDGGNLASFLYMLKHSGDAHFADCYNKIEERVHFVMPQFAHFDIEPLALTPDYTRLCWRTTGNSDYLMGPEQMSDGTLRFIALATLLMQPSELMPPLLLLDEPELGLHPLAIDLLAHIMRVASCHTQIIVATQSERLIDAMNAEDVIVAQWDAAAKCSNLHRLNKEELSAWLEEYSLSELWEKNVIGGQP